MFAPVLYFGGMKPLFYLLIFLATAGGIPRASAQSIADAAKAKAIEGVGLVDEGKLSEGIASLNEAIRMEPENYHWAYELGYAFYVQKDYKKAVAQYRKIVDTYPDADAQCYQMLGNAYDVGGDSAAALRSYREGLKKFPASGMLLMEIGNMRFAREDYNAALGYYEKGIAAEPSFASNYYRAAMLYLSSSEKVWGMIYGETFMNMERNTERTATMSKRLYDTYLKSIRIISDTSMSVDFTKNMVMSIDDVKGKDGKVKLPFAGMVYEPLILLSVISVKTLDINSLSDMRSNFVKAYYDQHRDQEYPNLLFAYQKQLQSAGHLEAYNHWILMKGDETAFTAWRNAHGTAWEKFVGWFGEHKMVVDKEHHLNRD